MVFCWTGMAMCTKVDGVTIVTITKIRCEITYIKIIKIML